MIILKLFGYDTDPQKNKSQLEAGLGGGGSTVNGRKISLPQTTQQTKQKIDFDNGKPKKVHKNDNALKVRFSVDPTTEQISVKFLSDDIPQDDAIINIPDIIPQLKLSTSGSSSGQYNQTFNKAVSHLVSGLISSAEDSLDTKKIIQDSQDLIVKTLPKQSHFLTKRCEEMANFGVVLWLRYREEIKQILEAWFQEKMEDWSFRDYLDPEHVLSRNLDKHTELVEETIKANIMHVLSRLITVSYLYCKEKNKEKMFLEAPLAGIAYMLCDQFITNKDLTKATEQEKTEFFDDIAERLLKIPFPNGAEEILIPTVYLTGSMVKAGVWNKIKGVVSLVLRQLYIETSTVPLAQESRQEKEVCKLIGCKSTKTLANIPTFFTLHILKKVQKHDLSPYGESLDWVIKEAAKMVRSKDPTLQNAGKFIGTVLEAASAALMIKVGNLVIDPKSLEPFLLQFVKGGFLKLTELTQQNENPLKDKLWADFLLEFLKSSFEKESGKNDVNGKKPKGVDVVKGRLPKGLEKGSESALVYCKQIVKDFDCQEKRKKEVIDALDKFSDGKQLNTIYRSHQLIEAFRSHLQNKSYVRKLLLNFLREYAPFLKNDGEAFNWLAENVWALVSDRKSKELDTIWSALESSVDTVMLQAIHNLKQSSGNKGEFKLVTVLLSKLSAQYNDLFDVSDDELKQIKDAIRCKNQLLDENDPDEKELLQKKLDTLPNTLLNKFQTVVHSVVKAAGVEKSDDIPLPEFLRSLIRFDDEKWTSIQDNKISFPLYLYFAELALPLLEEKQNRKLLLQLPQGDTLDKQMVAIAQGMCVRARKHIKFDKVAAWLAGKLSGRKTKDPQNKDLAEYLEKLLKSQDSDEIWKVFLPRYVKAHLIQVAVAIGSQVQKQNGDEIFPLLATLAGKIFDTWKNAKSKNDEEVKQYETMFNTMLSFIGWSDDQHSPLSPYFISKLKETIPDFLSLQLRTSKAVWLEKERNLEILRSYKNGKSVEVISGKVLDLIFNKLKVSVVDVQSIVKEIVNLYPMPEKVNAAELTAKIEKKLATRGVTVSELVSMVEAQKLTVTDEFVKKLKESGIKERLNQSLITVKALTGTIRKLLSKALPGYSLTKEQAESLAKQVQLLLTSHDPAVWDFLRGHLEATIFALVVKAARTHIKTEDEEEKASVDLVETLATKLFSVFDANMALEKKKREQGLAQRLLTDFFGIKSYEDVPSVPPKLRDLVCTQLSKLISHEIIGMYDYQATKIPTQIWGDIPIHEFFQMYISKIVDHKRANLSKEGALNDLIKTVLPEDCQDLTDAIVKIGNEVLTYKQDSSGIMKKDFNFKQNDLDHNLEQMLASGSSFASDLCVDVFTRIMNRLSELSPGDKVKMVNSLMKVVLSLIKKINKTEPAEDGTVDKDHYDDLVKMLMEIAYPKGHQDFTMFPERIRLMAWRIFNRSILPKYLPKILERFFDVQTIRKVVIKFSDSVNDALKMDIASDEKEPLTGSSEEDALLNSIKSTQEILDEEDLKKTIGELAIAGIEFARLPLSWMFLNETNKEDRIKLIAKHAGGPLVKKLQDKDFITDMLKKIIKVDEKAKTRADQYLDMVTQADVKQALQDPVYNLIVKVVTELWGSLHGKLDQLIDLLTCGHGQRLSNILRQISHFIVFGVIGTLCYIFIWSWLHYLVYSPLYKTEEKIEKGYKNPSKMPVKSNVTIARLSVGLLIISWTCLSKYSIPKTPHWLPFATLSAASATA